MGAAHNSFIAIYIIVIFDEKWWEHKTYQYHVKYANLPLDMSRGELSMHFSRLTFHLKIRSRLWLSSMFFLWFDSLGFDVHLPFDLQRTELDRGWVSLIRLSSGCCADSGWRWGLLKLSSYSLNLSCQSSKVPVKRVSSKEGGVLTCSLKVNVVSYRNNKILNVTFVM